MPTVQVGQVVWVPASRIGVAELVPSALVERKVLSQDARTVTVDSTGGNTARVATKLVHDHTGIAIIRIGDMASEATLLDPLAKSILQFCRLLMPDDFVRLYEVRSLLELDTFWAREHGAYRYLVLVGHGGDQGLKLFGEHDWITPESARDSLLSVASTSKVVISLCCSTGRAAFAKTFSNHEKLEALIAPFNSIHGADASRFTQELLAYALLDGLTTKVAFKHAEQSIGGGRDFRLWKQGRIDA